MTAPVQPDNGGFAHYINKDALRRGLSAQEPVEALCGRRWIPSSNDNEEVLRLPVCPECKSRYEALPPGAPAAEDRDELDREVSRLRRQLAAVDTGDLVRVELLQELSSVLIQRYRRRGDLADLDEAVQTGKEAVRLYPRSSPRWPFVLGMFGITLQSRYARLGMPADLADAITAGQQSVAAVPAGTAGRAEVLISLANALNIRFGRTAVAPDLDAAVEAAREAVAETEGDGPRQFPKLVVLGEILRARSTQFGVLPDLEEAVGAHRRALTFAPANAPVRPALLERLGETLRDRYSELGLLTDLDEAIAVYREAVALLPPDEVQPYVYLADLVIVLRQRFQVTGVLADIDEAVEIARQVLNVTPSDYPDRRVYSGNLARALQVRFMQTDAPADLDEAITAQRSALESTPEDDPFRYEPLSGLGLLLQLRSNRHGHLKDADEAVAAMRAALDALPAGHSDWKSRMGMLGSVLYSRYRLTSSLADLDEAATLLREAARATPAGRPDRPAQLSLLGVALGVRFIRLGNAADLDEAVDACQEAADIVPAGSIDKPLLLANLGELLRARFARSATPADLDAAINVHRETVDIVPPDHPARPSYLTNLGNALRDRFNQSGALADLDEAITVTQEAVDYVRPDGPGYAEVLLRLGRGLAARFERTGEQGDLDEAMRRWRDALMVSAAAPLTRLNAGWLCGRTNASRGQWDEAATAYEAAIELVPLATPRRLQRPDQEHLLAGLGGLAGEAAACCIHAGRPERAVELLEQGRAILLGQALDTRTELAALADQYPTLAERFAALRDDLDRAPELAGPLPIFAPGIDGGVHAQVPTSRLLAERQREASAAFDELLADIRAKPGLAGFLRPLRIHDLLPAAQQGPVVMINTSRFGSHAVILTSAGVLEPVPLEHLTPERVVEEVSEFLVVTRGLATEETVQPRLAAVLGWLWDAIAAPVMDRLGLAGPPAQESWPRVWWCVPGLLSFLPLQAAGHHETRFSAAPLTVADRVVSSYTPTIRALIHARRRPQEAAADRPTQIVIVAMPHTPSETDLPSAEAEAELLQRQFPAASVTLAGPDATRDTVIQALPSVPWAHFACHGFADLANPSASCLLLYDHQRHPLTVTDVARMRMAEADLAFLSSCSTASPGATLTDESIHLASSFQLAGYRHVIGTLWPVGDYHASQLAAELYAILSSDETTGMAATALHQVTRRLRNRWPRMPLVWASHIHVGA